MRKINFLKFLSLIGLISLVCFFVKNVSASTTTLSSLGIDIDSDFSTLDEEDALNDSDLGYVTITQALTYDTYEIGDYSYYYGLYGYYDQTEDCYYFVEVMYLQMTPIQDVYPVVNAEAIQAVAVTSSDSDVDFATVGYSPTTSEGSTTDSVSVGVSANSEGVASISMTESHSTSTADIQYGIISQPDSFENVISFTDFESVADDWRYNYYYNGNNTIDDAYTYTFKSVSVNITRVENFSDFYYTYFTFEFGSYVLFYTHGKYYKYSGDTNSDDDAGLTSTTFKWRYKTPGGSTGSGSDKPHTIASTRN